ncbi:transmembrane protein 241-like [Anneissia japonica]|uniref:transmembrane protein 241-like n=1 Tax=Anneissia japonica TaxID=1529436 RepID=UPI001425A44B|nr:transmembrane protein 241-like [Anneissia japonica]
MERWFYPLIYCFVFVSANSVNKYVLSVLRFTFPTLFQGWQTLVGFLLLGCISVLGHFNFTPPSRGVVFPWIPAIVLFVLSIYSASKALSKLPVPIFCVLHSSTEIILACGDWLIFRGISGSLNQFSLVLIILSCGLVWQSDPEVDMYGYIWMASHVLSSGLYSIITTLKRSPQFSEFDKLLYNYLGSVIILAPSSIILGDVVAAQHFPHWYLHKFYIGCFLSGILGGTLGLLTIHLSKSMGAYHFKVVLVIKKFLTFFTRIIECRSLELEGKYTGITVCYSYTRRQQNIFFF